MHSWPSTDFAPMRTSPSWARILRAVADPRPAPEVDHRVLADLEGHARADEGEAVGLQAPAEAQLQPRQAHEQARVVGREHAVRAHPAQQHERAAVARLGLAADVRRQPGDPWRCDDRCHGRKGSLRGSMAEDSLAQRLLAGDKRALARAITLVESDDPAGWELVREVYPKTGQAAVIGLTGAPGAGKSTLIGALIKLRRAADREVARALDRPVLALHARRAARRPHPPDRALPRPRRLHPLDGQPRRARRPQRGGAAGGAAHGRRRQGRRVPGDRGRRPGRGRHHRPRRHGRARPHARLGRLDPGAEGRDHGDPRHHRRQQGRPPADRHDGARDPRRAVAGARSAAGACRSSRPRPCAARASRRWSSSSTRTARYIVDEGTLSERRRRNLRNEVLGAVHVPPAPPPGGAPGARTTSSRRCSTRSWRAAWTPPARRARSSSASTPARRRRLRR